MVKDKRKEVVDEPVLAESPIIQVSSALPGLNKVRLLREHTDNGRTYSKGDYIEVDDSTLTFLVLNGIIEIKN